MFDWLTESSDDLMALGLSVTLLAGYHAYLLLRLRRNPNYTIQAVNRAARTAWTESVMGDGERAILAVQTLRNSTMAATFLASTAILLIIGALNLSSQAESLGRTLHITTVQDPEALWASKLLVLVVDLFVAFFSFSMSVRLYNHVGYQVSIPHVMRPDELTPARVAFHLNRAGRYFSIGIRAYYFCVPLLFWLFGPHMLVAASAALTVTLYGLDRTPAAETGGSRRP
jgi:uncharacterized membrane protein